MSHIPATQVERLLRMRWWDWPLERLEQNMPALCGADVDGLRALWRRWRAEAGEGA